MTDSTFDRNLESVYRIQEIVKEISFLRTQAQPGNVQRSALEGEE